MGIDGDENIRGHSRSSDCLWVFEIPESGLLKSKFSLSVKSFKKIEPKKVYEFVPPES